jgi:hypothetical protein
MKEVYDENMVMLVDEESNATEEQDQAPAYSWFLFKALETGETQITIQQRTHLIETLQD